MYEKKIIFIICYCFLFTFVFSSCRTTKINDVEIIERNSRTIGQLETTINELDRTIIDSRNRIENIISTSRNITDTVERIEYLFGQYEFEVELLLNRIESIRTEIEIKNENNNNSDDDFNNYDDNKNHFIIS